MTYESERQRQTDDEKAERLGLPNTLKLYAGIVSPSPLQELWDAETIRKDELPSDDEIEQVLQHQAAQLQDEESE